MVKSVGSETKFIAKHTGIYGLANVLDRTVSFLMLPIYTRYLTPSDYGVLELIYMTTALLSLVVGMGISSAVGRFYFDFDHQEQRDKVISTGFLGYGTLAILITLIFLPFSKQLSIHILDSAEFSSYFTLALLTFGIGMIMPIGFTYFRVTHKSGTLLLFKVSKTLVTICLNIYYVVFAKQGVYGILLASLISDMLYTIVISLYVLHKTGIHNDWKLLKDMIKFGLPLIPSNIAGFIVNSSDRYFIKEYANLNQTGIYSLGYKFGTLVNTFVTSPFVQIWTPRRFEKFQQDDAEEVYAKIFTYFVSISLFVGLGISVMSKGIIRVMTTEPFWDAYKVIPIIVLSYIIFSFHYHFNVGIMMKKATKYIAYINVTNGILNLTLNFILISRYHIWGAAYATLTCFIFKAIATYYISNKLYKVEVEWRRLVVLFAVAFGLYFGSTFVTLSNAYFESGAKFLVACLFPVILFLTNFFSKEERQKIIKLIKTRSID